MQNDTSRTYYCLGSKKEDLFMKTKVKTKQRRNTFCSDIDVEGHIQGSKFLRVVLMPISPSVIERMRRVAHGCGTTLTN